MDNVTAITGEHIILEGDTIELRSLGQDLKLSEELSLVPNEKPTDPYNTSTMRILRQQDFR